MTAPTEPFSPGLRRSLGVVMIGASYTVMVRSAGVGEIGGIDFFKAIAAAKARGICGFWPFLSLPPATPGGAGKC